MRMEVSRHLAILSVPTTVPSLSEANSGSPNFPPAHHRQGWKALVSGWRRRRPAKEGC